MKHFVPLAAVLAVVVAVSVASAVPFKDGSEVVDTGGYMEWGSDIKVTVSTTSTTSGLAALTPGAYTVTCDVVSHGDVGSTGVTAGDTDRRIPADYPYPVMIRNETIMALRGTTTGVCNVSRDVYR